MFFSAVNKAEFDRLDTEKYTLVLPAVSVGNVGQLTVDVLISTTQAEIVGTIYDDSLIPLIGNNPYVSADSGKTCRLSTSCDVYASKVNKLLFIQQRATFVVGKRKQFRQKLLQWVKEQKFHKVLLISSTFAHMRSDQQLGGSQHRYLATEAARSSIPKDAEYVQLEDSPDEYGRMKKRMPGSGIANTLFSDCSEENIGLVILLAFCSEGDNAPDALKMAEYANKWLNIHIKNKLESEDSLSDSKRSWKIPQSWQLNFGNAYNQVMY
ncbi:proteasome assembly chaperone 2-like [Watersipora subatra]|uniref:proteasome assembly chaperone 2-like n=1 Tax=Watersipora subatra TaxID=2589382 RepID=UPI00355C39E2